MSLTLPNLVPQRPFCYLNFISAAKYQMFGNETYDAHVLASSKTYRNQNKPKKWIPNPLRYMSFWQVSLSFKNFLNLYYNKDLGIKNSYLIQYLSTDVNTAVSTSALRNWYWADDILGEPSLRFLFFYVLFVSKGNLLDFF